MYSDILKIKKTQPLKENINEVPNISSQFRYCGEQQGPESTSARQP